MPPTKRAVTIRVNGEPNVTALDLAATAGGLNRAVDLVFDDIEPQHGMVAINFTGPNDGEAIVQAIEVGPGPGGVGAKQICLENK